MWTENHIREKIAEFEKGIGWYQNIDLGHGINTKSRIVWGEELSHPRTRWNVIAKAVPKKLKGYHVLDVGCNAGFFAFEAKRRGADYVCGIDLKQEYSVMMRKVMLEKLKSPIRKIYHSELPRT